MVIKELLKQAVALIGDRKYSNPLLESILVLSHLLNVDKSYIYAYYDQTVEESIVDEFMELIKKRSTGYPIQYILKEKEFMGINFYVEEGVLIPRADTELLVEYVIEYIEDKFSNKNINLLDMGSGSGAISLSIGKYCPQVQVYGVDIGDIPIRISNINKEKLDLSNVNFYQGDLFNPLLEMNLQEKFDIIVSNPPYICKPELEDLEPEVKDFEPYIALHGGKDGLEFYRRISKESKKYLTPKGLLVYEVGYKQSEDVKNIMIKEGFNSIQILKDIQGIDRVIYGQIE